MAWWTFQCSSCKRATSFSDAGPHKCECGANLRADQGTGPPGSSRSGVFTEREEKKPPQRLLIPLRLAEQEEEDGKERLFIGVHTSLFSGRLLHVQGREEDVIRGISVGNLDLIPRNSFHTMDVHVGLLRGVLLGHEIHPGETVVVRAFLPIQVLLVFEKNV